MVELTLFEVHLDGAEFTANAPFSSGDADDAESTDWEEFGTDGDGEGGGPNPGGLVVAVLVLVVVAVLVRKLLGGGGDEAE